ncbi:MAG: J domain-containing protein [Cyanobacteriota bacterium]
MDDGASPQAIKKAYWRMAKAHHPDMGGDAEAFHRLDAAYRLLMG